MQKDIPKAVRKGRKGKGGGGNDFVREKGICKQFQFGKRKRQKERERERNQGDAVAAKSVFVPTLAI